MTRYEYRYVRATWNFEEEAITALQREELHEWGIDFPYEEFLDDKALCMTEFLNGYGADGWQLTQQTTSPAPESWPNCMWLHLIFMREAQ